MNKLICVVLALVLCLGCTGCGSTPAEQEAVAVTEVAETKNVTATEVAETQPQETVPVLEEPAGEAHMSPEYRFSCGDQQGNDTGDLEVYDCRMYPTENGTTIFAVDYKAVAGLQMIIFGYADDGNNDPNYWNVVETLTTDEETTFVFEVENEVLDQIYHPGVFFRDQYGFDVAAIEIFHRGENIYTTDGNPVGEAEQLLFMKDGNVTVYNAFMQPLDNGYVRFTLECKPQKDRYICFYSDPSGERFTCYGGPTSGEKETIIADIWAEYAEGLHGFNFSFYKPNEKPDARVWLNSATQNFDELVAANFNGFIGGDGDFMLLYYGIFDEAILGATLTAEDGSSVVVTEELLDRNGDGYSLVFFEECKAKKGDTVFVTVSKEGYEDISLELYVH